MVMAGEKLLGYAITKDVDHAEADANADLWAAAPDLLTALEAIVRQPQGHTADDCMTDLSACIRIARAALAQAEGSAA
jgi:hypothetical protein